MKATGVKTAPFGLGSEQAQAPMMDAAPDPSDPTPRLSASAIAPSVSAPVEQPRQTPLQIAGQAISELPQNAGVLARGFTKGAMSVPTMIADPITVLLNKVLPPEMQQLPPSQGLEVMFNALGVKDAQTKAQEVLESVGMGLGSGASSLGAGAALGAGAPALGMGTKLQGVGQILAAQPAAELAGSAASTGASKIAEQQGASPLAQAGIGIAAGALGSRLASPSPRVMAKGVQGEESIGETIRKAASGDKTARQAIADMAAISPDARKAARDLEIELPADVFSDNPQVRAAAGLGRSVAGSAEESAWQNTVKAAVERADEVIEDFGATFIEGSPAPAVASARVKDSLMAAKKELADQAKALYDEIDVTVPKSTPASFDSTKAALAEIATEVGEGGMSAQEKRLLDMVADPETTYGRLMREKNLIGQAIAKKDSPYGNMEAGTLKRLYGALAEDQLDSVGNVGSPELKEQLISANLMYGKEREIGKQIVSLFGKDFSGSIADKMRMAITSSSKGDTGAFTRLMESVPDDLKKEVTATALASVARSGSGATKGNFGFSEFAKVYQGLRANPEIYKQIARNLGPDSDAMLRDLYEVSKRVSDARALVLTTGKANQALLDGLTAQNLVEKALSSVLGRSAVAAGGAATGGLLGGGVFGATAGAGMSNAIVESLTRGEKAKLEAVGKMFRSREFQDLIIEAGTTNAITPAMAKKLARSSAFQAFAKAVKLPGATDQLDTWILSAVQAKAAEDIGEQVQAKRQMKELER